jgi:hypothetical protein
MIRGRTGLLLVFGLASLAAVASGAVVCAASEVPAGLWIRNLAAWAVGALLAVGLSFAPGTAPRVALWAAPIALLASFLGPAPDGVHRWIDLGPMQLNAAMVVLPAAIVALAVSAKGSREPWLAALACLVLLAGQPDASQATTLAAIMALVALKTMEPPPVRAALAAASAGIAIVAWLRPDPLQPVPEVEQIIGLAYALSPGAAVAALLSLAATAAAPVLFTARASGAVRLAGLALGLCLLLWSATPFLGAFPVPLVGIGLSPILGAWLGVGLLAGRLARDQSGAGSASTQPPGLAKGAS